MERRYPSVGRRNIAKRSGLGSQMCRTVEINHEIGQVSQVKCPLRFKEVVVNHFLTDTVNPVQLRYDLGRLSALPGQG